MASQQQIKLGRCLHCGRSWDIVEGAYIPHDERREMFPVCKECFNILPREKLKYYVRELVRDWIRQDPLSAVESIRSLGYAECYLDILKGLGAERPPLAAVRMPMLDTIKALRSLVIWHHEAGAMGQNAAEAWGKRCPVCAKAPAEERAAMGQHEDGRE